MGQRIRSELNNQKMAKLHKEGGGIMATSTKRSPRELTIIRYVNGERVHAPDLSQFVVVNSVARRIIDEVNRRVNGSVSTTDIPK